MPTRTTITAAATGFSAGLCIAVETVDGVQSHGLVRMGLASIVVGFFPTVVVTLVLLGILRRWIARSEVRNRRINEETAEQRRQLSEEFDRRSGELRQREEAVNRHSALNQEQYRTLVDQLREARKERDDAILQRDALQGDFDVLAGEYNGMVLGEVDDRAAKFNRPQRSRLSGVRDRARERVASDVARLPHIGHQVEPEQHARPAEG
ncbi:hypothetical protein [Streptomyces sp. NPDC088847]|uniref:hypothetical protein n=1 Tax=Streptomyces sp. NPDC088847 TaxID=3365909 RepID=UPI00380565A5